MTKRKKQLPDIQEIVDRRVAAGIAGHAEFILWANDDLVDEDYSDEFKQQLLDEVERAERLKQLQPVPESSGPDWLMPNRKKGS